ncbi:MAG: hypothetical protein ACXW2G_04630 [Burkholderiaceae bacterium]
MLASIEGWLTRGDADETPGVFRCGGRRVRRRAVGLVWALIAGLSQSDLSVFLTQPISAALWD